MEEILDRCCGLDVHRDTITACIMLGNGRQKSKEIRTFTTFTRDIHELANWLRTMDVKHVAVESTGIYWKPIFNVFDGDFDVCLVNPRHVKNVPGRKTDVKDSEWLCKLLKCGLLTKSFIPPKAIVRLRELVRYRSNLTRDLSRAKSRVIKMLENANIKLASVFSDVFGLTSWTMITKLVSGETEAYKLLEFIDPRCRASFTDIQKSLEGTLEAEDRALLQVMMRNVKELESLINIVEMHIKEHSEPYISQLELLQTIPGVKELAAVSILAEIGADMNQFKNADHLSAWGGMCPGNNQSAGKTLSSRIRKGNRHLKVILTQVGWAISRTKQTYLGTKYRSLAIKKGKKRAIIAVGRKVLVICYHMLKANIPFHELGVDFLDKLEPERKAKYHAQRLEELGFHVVLNKKIA